MLPNFVRSSFYALHQRSGFARVLADGLSYGFMGAVKILRLKPPYDLTPLIIVSHRYRFIYIGLPKVATRSFREFFLSDHAEDFDIESFETRQGFQKALTDYPDYYVFSFVRDPLERALSCYYSKIGHKDLSLLKRARIMSFYKGLTPGMSFEEFCLWLNSAEGQDACADRHWMSQHRFLYGSDGAAPLCDFVGQFETLSDDLKKISNHLECPDILLPQSGWISKKTANVTPEALALIHKRYARDYEVFSYALSSEAAQK